MTVTMLLYNQYLQTITPPMAKPATRKSIEITFDSPSHNQSSKSSPLLSLPLELRLQIYAHAFALHSPKEPKHPTHVTTPLFAGKICTSLLLVNRQTYHEARLLPFQINKLTFTKCFGSSVFSAHRFLAKLEDWQRVALRSVVIAVVGREIVERWRSEEGWEAVIALLNKCKRIDVRVVIQEGDAWIGNLNEDVHGWGANCGGNVFPGPLRTRWASVMPAISKIRGGWVQKLLEGGERAEGMRLEYACVGIDDGPEKVKNGLDWNREES